MVTLKSINTFLGIVQPKLTTHGFYMLTRPKNLKTLLDLNFSSADVKKTLLELKAQDYSQGPLPDKLGAGLDMWVFGKKIQNREIYIKITKGRENERVLLISFHEADGPMRYPFRV